MAKRDDTEVKKLTKVAEKLFVFYSKGVRFSLTHAGTLSVEYADSYRLTRYDKAFLTSNADRVLFLLPFWRVKLFHSVMGSEDVDFLRSCNINLELSENSKLRSPVLLPAFEAANDE